MFIFWTDFRNWITRQLDSIGRAIIAVIPAIGHIIGIYSIVLGGVSVVALIFIIIALLFNSPWLTSFAFVLAISMVMLTWIPAGIVLKVFRVNKAVVPKTMKTFIAWVAFVGFLGLMMPGIFSFKALMGAALIGFIILGVTTKINAIDKIVFPLVVVMCLSVAWKHFFPEDFRSTTRYVVSWSKRVNTAKDRGSINNEMNAATTDGVILRNVNVLYKDMASLAEEKHPLFRGTIVKFVSHKQEVCVIDGQGFVQIQLAKANGSFVKGEKFWIEAEYVQIATPREITPEDDSLLPSNQSVAHIPAQTPMVKDSIFTTGEYYINVQGDTPYNIVIVPSRIGCAMYSLSSEKYNYQIKFSQGEIIQGSPTAKLNYYERPKFRLSSQQGDLVKLTVI
ncbi:MAG TPA: hypothetical protein VFD16_02725 [Candidatus Saccharimonadales bacterium]|nr:hypothetical protein [Candidatus Saccharimonadales bacterium]